MELTLEMKLVQELWSNAVWRRYFNDPTSVYGAPGMTRREAYTVYLGSAAWHLRRDAAMERTGGACGRCSIARATEVHHQSYARLGDELPADLAPLCGACHMHEHGLLSDDAVRQRVARLAAGLPGVCVPTDSVSTEGWSSTARERRRRIINRMFCGAIDAEPAVNAIRVIAMEEAARPRSRAERERNDTADVLREVYADDE